MKSRFIFALTASFLLTACAGMFGKGATTDMSKLQLGMSPAQVTQTVGQPVNVVEAGQAGNQKFEVWEYPGGRGERFRVYFTDGKLDAWRRTPY